jgi:imidazole glycerol-phosphate synthase subunit HisH
MITIVDYGLGNIQAIANIYKRLHIPVTIATSAEQLGSANKIVLPGVGAFDWAMCRLNESGMRPLLDRLVAGGSDVLGICVGMQMMAKRSDEGTLDGLNWIDADVKIFDQSKFPDKTPLPHMGWNDVSPCRTDSLFRGMESDPRFYFLHSYYFAPHRERDVLAVTDYNGPFVCSLQANNLYGVQFHPEKSHQWGIQLLKNFAEI